MFWTYNTTSPQIDIILCKEDLTLHELLDQENVLQELKAQNLKLIEFLIKPDVLRELVSLITTEPEPDVHPADQYRYPNLACELLTSDLPALNERLASEEILNKLYGFLQNDPPLNPLLSSYFSRTLSILISRKSEQNWFSYQYTCLQALEFLKAKEEFLELLLKHMGTSSIMDLMLNLITLIEGPELKQSLWNWLQSQNVIRNLIGLLGPHSEPDCQTNTSALLGSIIQKLRENLIELNDKTVSDPILHLLESAQITELLLNTVFDNDNLCDTSIQSGVDVLLILMQPYLPGDARSRQALNYTVHDNTESGLVIPNINSNSGKKNNSTNDSDDANNAKLAPPPEMISAILPFIEKFRHILTNPLSKEPIKLTNGVISPPFGKARLLIAKLIDVLISLNSSEINREIMRCDIPELLLDLFYAYPSNNFLHTEVEKMIAHAIDQVNECTVNEGEDHLLFAHLLKKCELLKKLLDIWQENLEKESAGNSRKGYMGHVVRIATLIHIQTGKSQIFNELLTKECSTQVIRDWNAFVNDTLVAVIEKHSTCLGGIRPKLSQSNDNSFEESVSSKELKSEFKTFDQDDDRNIIFSSDPTLSDYGNEEGFRFSNDLTEEEEERLERQTKMFDLMCTQKWQSFKKGLDNNDEEDDSNDLQCTWSDVRNWESDDENSEENAHQISDPWSKLGNVSDPWASGSSNDTSNDSWNSSADANWAKFDENFAESFRSSSPAIESSSTSDSSSTMVVNFDKYDLFGGDGNRSGFEETDMLNSFANVKLSSSGLDQIDSGNQKSLEGSNWVKSEEKNAKSNGYIMGTKFNCYDEQDDKEGADEMFSLESMRGNTLAEKIANAENDIRYQDEEEQQQQHQAPQNEQQILMNSFEEANDRLPCNNSAVECDIRLRSSGSSRDEEIMSPEDDRMHEPNVCSYLSSSSQQDCLTENSFDFVTADNNTNTASDAESSVEFGDAENSLELEEEDSMTDRSCASPSEDLASPTDKDICGERDLLAVENVPIVNDNFNDQCNSVQSSDDVGFDNGTDMVEDSGAKTKKVTELPVAKFAKDDSADIHHVMNGDVAEHDESKDCDKFVETSKSLDLSHDQIVEANVVVDEPA